MRLDGRLGNYLLAGRVRGVLPGHGAVAMTDIDLGRMARSRTAELNRMPIAFQARANAKSCRTLHIDSRDCRSAVANRPDQGAGRDHQCSASFFMLPLTARIRRCTDRGHRCDRGWVDHHHNRSAILGLRPNEKGIRHALDIRKPCPLQVLCHMLLDVGTIWACPASWDCPGGGERADEGVAGC